MQVYGLLGEKSNAAPMTALGQTATSWGVCVTAALPPKADIRLRCNICRNGPTSDSCTAKKESRKRCLHMERTIARPAIVLFDAVANVDPVNLEHVLGDIQTDRGNLLPDVIRL